MNYFYFEEKETPRIISADKKFVGILYSNVLNEFLTEYKYHFYRIAEKIGEKYLIPNLYLDESDDDFIKALTSDFEEYEPEVLEPLDAYDIAYCEYATRIKKYTDKDGDFAKWFLKNTSISYDYFQASYLLLSSYELVEVNEILEGFIDSDESNYSIDSYQYKYKGFDLNPYSYDFYKTKQWWEEK